MRTWLVTICLGLGLVLAGSYTAGAGEKPAFDADLFAAGKKVFKRKQCSGCHALDSAEDGEKGPGLKGVYARRGRDWLVKYLADPEGVVPTDERLKKLLEKYPDGMPNPELSEEQRDQVLLYIAYDGEKP